MAANSHSQNVIQTKMAANVTQNKMAARSATQDSMAANVGRQNQTGNEANNQLTSSMLLQQIQTISELQNSGIVHHADPAAQVSSQTTANNTVGTHGKMWGEECRYRAYSITDLPVLSLLM